jgi:diguanylate cyclase (GGDEF)-like protein
MSLGLTRMRAHATAILMAASAALAAAAAAAPVAGRHGPLIPAAACVLVALCAGVTWRFGEQFGELTIVGLIATVIALVTLTASTGDGGPTGDVLLLLLPALVAACFLPLFFAALAVLLCSGAYGWIMAREMGLGAGLLWWLSATAVFTSAGATVLVLRRELTAKLVELSGLAHHDALTGLINRREFDRRLSYELARCARTRQTCTVLMCDLDNFKAVNDEYGHPAGDAVLKRVANELLAGVRTIDTVARIGGEEMAVLLVECDIADAHHIAERLRRAVATHGENASAVTISIGVADSGSAASAEELIAAADRALYEAKRAGRDRVGYGTVTAATILRPA